MAHHPVDKERYDVAAFDRGQSYIGTEWADKVEDFGRNIVSGIHAASQDQEGWHDDALRFGGKLLQGAGAVAGAPGIKQGLQLLDAPVHYLAEGAGHIAEKAGVDPRLAKWGVRAAETALTLGGGIAKKTGKLDDLARIASQRADDISANLVRNLPAQPVYAYGGELAEQSARRAEDVLQPWQSTERTRYQRAGKTGTKLRELRNTPDGMKRIEAALAYKKKHGTLAGFKKTQKPWILPDGDVVNFKSTNSGVRLKLKSDADSAALTRTSNEFMQTHGKSDWDNVMEGFTDPKALPLEKIEGHHKHMVEGYDWAFVGTKPKEAREITEHFFKKGTPLGKTQFNRNNLPRPVHKALHSWMDKQKGLNGLDMPSLKGLTPKQRKDRLEVYMEMVQPVMDEATFILMRRYKQMGKKVDWTKSGAYKKLFTKGVKMIDQFTDAQNPYKLSK